MNSEGDSERYDPMQVASRYKDIILCLESKVNFDDSNKLENSSLQLEDEGYFEKDSISEDYSPSVLKYAYDKGKSVERLDIIMKDVVLEVYLYNVDEESKTEKMQILLRDKCEKNESNSSKKVPLQVKTTVGFKDIITLILSNIKNVNLSDLKQNMVEKKCENYEKILTFYKAALQGNTDMLQQLLHFDTILDANSFQTSPLHLAVKSDHENAVLSVLQYGMDINWRNSFKETILLFAAMYGNESLTRYLIKLHANINTKDSKDFTPLHFCSMKGHTKVAKLLLENDADIHAESINKNTPLHFAAYNNNKELVKLLLMKGAFIEHKNVKGNTALHLASQVQNVDIVKLLLENKADVNCLNNNNETPLILAAKYSLDVVTDLLMYYKANVNARDIFQNTALHIATKSGFLKITEILLENKADVNSQDLLGNTPLHLLKGKHGPTIKQIVLLLMLYGADFQMKNFNGLASVDFIRFYSIWIHVTEVTKLKSERLNYKHTLYDVCFMKPNTLALYVENENFKRLYYEGDKFKKDYPCYGFLLKTKFEKGLRQNKLINIAKDKLISITGSVLPDPCYERIFNFMHEADLIKFIDEDIDSLDDSK